MPKLVSVVVFLMLHACYIAGASPPKQYHLQFNIDNGLPSNNAYRVVKDSKGYLWFATENGVVKYNGYTFRVFNTNDGLPNNDVWQLYEDSYGRMWLHSFAYQLGYIQDDKYKSIDYETSNMVLKPDHIVQSGRYVYFTFMQKAFEKSLAAIDSVGHTTMIEEASGYASILSFDSIFYTFHKDGIIKGYSLEGSRKVPRATYNMNLNSVYTAGTNHQMYNDMLYVIGFKDNKIMVADLKKRTARYKYMTELGASPDERVHVNFFKPGSFYVITNESIYYVDSLVNLKYKMRVRDVLPGNFQVAGVLSIPERNLRWYTTTTGGAWLTVDDVGLFKHSAFSEKLTNAYNIKHSVGDYSFWLTKDRKDLYSLNSANQLRYMASYNDDLKAITQGRANSYYMAFVKGLYEVTPAGKLMHQIGSDVERPYRLYPTNENIIDSPSVLFLKNFTSIHSYSAKELFVFGGVDIRKITFLDTVIIDETILSDRTTSFFFDSALNRYFFYNKEKISVVDPVTNRYFRVNTAALSTVGIAGISSFSEDNNGNFFIHAGDKLFLYNFIRRRFVTVNVGVNLSNAKVAVHGNRLAIAGNFGFAVAVIRNSDVGDFRVYPNPKKIFYSDVTDFIIHRGIVQLSTDKGFYSFRLDDIDSLHADTDPDYITFITKIPTIKIIHDGDTLKIDQEHGRLDLDALNYYGVGTIQYQYMLPARDSQIATSISGEITFNDLEPGVHYDLYLNAKDDAWKSKTRHIHVYIMPYWYQTATWRNVFWISGIIFGILLVTLIVFITRYFAARANDKKRSLVDMELRALHSQINPHFIFNTLGTALFFISKKRYEEAYSHVSRFSKLLRTYLTSSRKRYITLAEEIAMLRNYIELQQIRFEEKFSYSIDIDNKVPASSILVPTLLLQPLVENSINHGLFHRPAGGFLSIRFVHGRDSTELICTIEDNGVGRQRSREIRKESVIQYESYGTALTKELIEIFKKYEDMNIYLEYIDKNGNDTGTIVKLTIRNLKYVA